MDPDSFDDVLLTFGQLQEQAQQPPRERTQEEIEREERAQERQRQIKAEMDEFNALREWDERIRLVESLRAQMTAIFWRGIEDMDQYVQTPTPIDWGPESERDELEQMMEEIWPTRTPPTPLDMDTAETESDSANDSELRLTRDTPLRSSGLTNSLDEPSEFGTDYDSGSDGLSDDGEPPPAPILGPTRGLTDDISEPELNEDEAESSNPPSLDTADTMVFEMEIDGPAAEDEINEDDDSENDSDSEIDFEMSMGRGRVLGPYDTPPRQPIAIRVRNRSAEEMAELDKEVFLDEVRGFSIGFHLNVFPWLVMRRVRRTRETALPGSFEHLLMHMFDDIRLVTVYQADVRRTGIERYMQARCEGASHGDALAVESSRADSSLPGSSSGRPAIVVRPGEGVSEDPSSALFPQELRALRLLVAPIREREAHFAWITSQTDRPVELKEQFQASRELIANFKRWLVRSLRQSETWSINPPQSTSPFHEERERFLSLRQYRLDACGAALRWEANNPGDVEPQDWLPGQQRRLLPYGPAHQPVHVTPDVQFSIAQGNEFMNVADVQGYAAELFTLLVQIAQWLALARGHAAVHLFCDFCRLFSLSGVDVSDAVQIASCEHLLAMEAWSDQSARSDPLSAGYAAESMDSGMVGAVGHGYDQLGRVLMGVESLFFRVGDDRRRRSVRGVGRRRF